MRAGIKEGSAVPHWTLLVSVIVCSGLIGAGARADTLDDDDFAERLAPCAACHGERGRSASEVYYPSIAGKPAGYLYAQLENYRAGRRRHAIMEGLLAHLSEDYLREIAAYYARQQAQWTSPSPARTENELARGRELVELGDSERGIPSCRACHGDALTGIEPHVPGLLGLRPEYLSAQLGAWRTGARQAAEPDCMAAVAERLARDDIGAVTAWIASRPFPADPSPAPAEAMPASLPLDCGVVR